MASHDSKRVKMDPPSGMPMEQLKVMAKAVFEHGLPKDFNEKRTFIRMFAIHYPMETIRLIDANPTFAGTKFRTLMTTHMRTCGTKDRSIRYHNCHLQVYDPHNQAYAFIDSELQVKLHEIFVPVMRASFKLILTKQDDYDVVLDHGVEVEITRNKADGHLYAKNLAQRTDCQPFALLML